MKNIMTILFLVFAFSGHAQRVNPFYDSTAFMNGVSMTNNPSAPAFNMQYQKSRNTVDTFISNGNRYAIYNDTSTIHHTLFITPPNPYNGQRWSLTTYFGGDTAIFSPLTPVGAPTVLPANTAYGWMYISATGQWVPIK